MFSLKALRRPEPLLFANVKAARRKAARGFTMLLLTTLTMLGFCGLARATAPPGTHLHIEDVSVDFTAKKILILGQMFNFGPGPLRVTLANVGNLTPICTPNFTVTPQTITCDLSGGIPPFPAAGDYLLTVSTGKGHSQIDEWDLTIGAVGPVGPQGPQGIPGIVGLEGQSCPSNQFVTGFSATGMIICSGETDPPPPPTCTNHTFTFSISSSAAGPFSDASWPGGTHSAIDPADTNCGVTVGAPSGDVILVGTLGDAWHIVSHTGYSNCFGTGGPNNDGVANPDCSQLNVPSFPNVTSGRPSCSNGLCSPLICGGNGVASDTYTVQCLP